MSLVNLVNVDYSVGGPLLLEKVDLAIEANERVCIVGRNGAGKSTLLKLIAGEIRPDDGEVRVQGGVRVAKLAQEVPHGVDGSIFDVVASALGHIGELLAQQQVLAMRVEEVGVMAGRRARRRAQARTQLLGEDLVAQALCRAQLVLVARPAQVEAGGQGTGMVLAEGLSLQHRGGLP